MNDARALGSGLALKYFLRHVFGMARPLRLELSGGLYHVTARGDGREDIYLGDADREAWLEVLGQVCRRFNWVCHA
jgi:putative transposase